MAYVCVHNVEGWCFIQPQPQMRMLYNFLSFIRFSSSVIVLPFFMMTFVLVKAISQEP